MEGEDAMCQAGTVALDDSSETLVAICVSHRVGHVIFIWLDDRGHCLADTVQSTLPVLLYHTD